jgi:aspartate/methionine/tyrosine aminotransferase
MNLEPFALERWQSIWEHQVEVNISESGIQPLRLEELLDTPDDLPALLTQELAYTQTNGTPDLRAAIASMYPDATAAHVEVTNGGSEANCIVLWHLVQPGDAVVLMTPNYMQAAGIARGLGAVVHNWCLALEDRTRWRPDIAALDRLVTPRTRLILVCNPNNPTGARFNGSDLDDICRIARQAGAWIVSDEIYRGAELDGALTPTMWGRYERVIVTSGLSKAYGLPGLRIGWVTGPPDLIETLWGVHDYTTIAPGALNDRLARMALAPERRARLLARTANILRTNYPVVRRWIDDRADALSCVPPEAGAIAFVRYRHAVNSTRLVERFRDEAGVLVVPGDHFGMDGYLRIGFGFDAAILGEALTRIGRVLDGIPHAR